MNPPSQWQHIGDAQSVVLPDGTYMLGNCCYRTQALLDFASLSWTLVSSGKADPNEEEGWTLLPNGKVLDVDVVAQPNTELYDPSKNSWSTAGKTSDTLVTGAEIGPQFLLPDGTVFVVGATGNTAVYDSGSGAWTAGPTLPTENSKQLDVADGPGMLLPDGNVLFPASPGLYHSPSYFFEYNGKKLLPVAAPLDAMFDSTYNIRLLMLPTGQALEDDGSNRVQIYTPMGKPVKGIEPKVTSIPSMMTLGDTYAVYGKKLNGYSQDNMYGDDVQNATNYPLVRITNSGTGHVFYARTHDFSSMPVASSAVSSAQFDLPEEMEYGPSTLVVVANGIASKPVSVTIQQTPKTAAKFGCRRAVRATRRGCR